MKLDLFAPTLMRFILLRTKKFLFYFSLFPRFDWLGQIIFGFHLSLCSCFRFRCPPFSSLCQSVLFSLYVNLFCFRLSFNMFCFLSLTICYVFSLCQSVLSVLFSLSLKIFFLSVNLVRFLCNWIWWQNADALEQQLDESEQISLRMFLSLGERKVEKHPLPFWRIWNAVIGKIDSLLRCNLFSNKSKLKLMLRKLNIFFFALSHQL